MLERVRVSTTGWKTEALAVHMNMRALRVSGNRTKGDRKD
jgi:hypothetical protein